MIFRLGSTCFSFLALLVIFCAFVPLSFASTTIPFTINLSEPVNVTGTPRIAIDVDGQTGLYANYASGTGTSALTFNYVAQEGDLDLNGVTISSPILLNGGTIKDLNGNNANLSFTVPNTSNVKIDYPSLSMDFVSSSTGRYTKNGVSSNNLLTFLSSAGGGFTRTSIGTYYNSSGVMQTAASGVPRLDYDPATNVAKGLLLEEQRTNLILRSGDFSNAAWSKTNSTAVANVVVAPDGTMGGAKLVENVTTNLTHTFAQSASASATTTYTGSFFAKAGERDKVRLWLRGLSSANRLYVDYNLQGAGNTNNLGVTGNFTSGSASISSVGGGWYRCTATVTTGAGETSVALNISPEDSSYSATYNGDGSSGLYLWGGQIEQGGFVTSYIPTTTAYVTRMADSIVLPSTGWYSQTMGTFFDDISWVSVASGTSYPMFFRVDDATNANRWNLFYWQGGSIGIDGYTSGVYQGNWPQVGSSTGSIKAAAAATTNNANAAFNGTIKTLDTSWSMPTVTQLTLTPSAANKWHKKIKYYPRRVSDTQLQLLTQ